MALSHDVVVYTNACVQSYTGSAAVFDGDASDGFYTESLELTPFSGKLRVGVGTSSGTYTIFSNEITVNILPDVGWHGTDVTVTGLTGSTLYYYSAQISDDGGSTWTDASDAEGSFTTTGAAPSLPTAAFTPSTATTGTAPFQVNFTDASTGTPTFWEWNFGAAGISNSQNPIKIFSSPGTYTVTLTCTNADGSDSEVKNSLITIVTGAPTAAFTANTTTGQRPLTVTFTDSATNSPTSWKWAFGDGDFSTLQSPTQIYQYAGTYTVTQTATNYLGSDSEVKTGYVTVLPIAASATFTATPVSGRGPLTVQFFGAPSGDTASAAWNFGDGSTTTAIGNPLHTYYGTGTYTATYTVTGVTGAGTSTATRTSYITVSTDDTYRAFLDEIRRQLLMNTDETSVCNDFVEFGGTSVVLRYIYNRVCRLQLEAGLLRKTSTTITATAAGVLTLPADLIEIRSIYANGVRLEPTDPRMADLTTDTWQTSPTGDYKGWYLEPGDPLTLHLVPAITPSTFECYYVYAPTEPTVPGDCGAFANFPLPFCFWWIIKYGVLADLLGNEGEMYDIKRANECEQLFQEGVALAKLALEGD